MKTIAKQFKNGLKIEKIIHSSAKFKKFCRILEIWVYNILIKWGGKCQWEGLYEMYRVHTQTDMHAQTNHYCKTYLVLHAPRVKISICLLKSIGIN